MVKDDGENGWSLVWIEMFNKIKFVVVKLVNMEHLKGCGYFCKCTVINYTLVTHF